MLKGYAGKILHVDLTNEVFRVEEPTEDFYRAYVGGSTLGAYYVMNGMDPKADALSEENVMVFSVGPITGVPMSGTSRHSVTTKSPLTGTIAGSEAGGYWAPEFRKTGFDAIVITGKAKSLKYLWIHNGEYELRDAEHIRGKVTKEAQEMIREELNDQKIRVAQIGPAGENLISYANIVNELAHFNGRNGMGAVMGSKNLRAIAVRGTLAVELENKAELMALAKYGANRVINEEGYQGFKQLGTNVNIDDHNITGGLPTRNWTSGTFEGHDDMTAQGWRDSVIKPGTCHACVQSCKRHVDPERTDAVDPKYGGPEYETVGMCGTNLGIGDHIMICRINELTAMYAMDSISFGGTVGFIMECFEKGLLTKEDTDGLEIEFGNGEAVLKLAEMVAYRKGFGDRAANGTKVLAEEIGPDAVDIAVLVKGKEFPAHMPKRKASLGLAYALVPYGSDHVSAHHDPSIEHEPLPYQLKSLGFDRTEVADELNDEKAKLFFRTQKAYSAIDTVSVCNLTFGLWTIFDLDNLVDAINYATGWKMTVNELIMVGEKRTHMMRAFNVKAGIGVDQDVLPKRMFEPLKGGVSEGKVVDEEAFYRTRDIVYELMMWDKETGAPMKSKLMDMNLDWVIDFMK